VKIVEVYSHLNGLEFIKVHQPKLWTEVVRVVEGIDAERLRTKISKERRMKGKALYSPKALNQAFDRAFRALDWKESRTSYWVTSDARLIRKTLHMGEKEQKKSIEDAGKEAIKSYNQTDFVKNRVAVEVQLGKYAFVAYDLFVKHLAFYVRDEIDVGVEILPMKSMQQQMSSGPSYYEGELYNLIREGRGVPAVPLVLVGIAP
jgi:hypothetical protein